MLERFRNGMTPEMPKDIERVVELFGRHLVALCLQVRDKPVPNSQGRRNLVFPGVLLCVREAVFYLTAGHVLKEVKQAVANDLFRIESAYIIDTFGADRTADYPIAFNFSSASYYHIDDKDLGLDFGLILLDEYYVKLLDANNIVPILEKNWASQHNVRFEFYFLFGFPMGFRTGEQTKGGDLIVTPTLVPVDVLDPIPNDLLQRAANSFLGKLRDGLDINIQGMSGGPIFGFVTGQQMKYWIVAIQSAWYPERRIVVGCPVARIGRLINKTIDAIRNEQTDNGE